MITEYLGHAFGSQGGGGGNCMHLFGVMIHHDTDGIVHVQDRKWSNKINLDGMPGMWGNGMWLQRSVVQGMTWLGVLTYRTGFNVLMHIMAHTWPIVIP